LATIHPGRLQTQTSASECPEVVAPLPDIDGASLFVPGEIGDRAAQGSRLVVLRENGSITGFEVICSCGRRTRVICRFAPEGQAADAPPQTAPNADA